MSVETLAETRAARLKAIERRLETRLSAAWSALNPADLAGSWPTVAPSVVGYLTAAQTLAAMGATEYVDSAVREASSAPEAPVALAPTALSGYATDGRPLAGLAYAGVVEAKGRLGDGAPVEKALRAGLGRLLLVSRGELGNTARLADGIAIAVEPKTTGYYRRLRLPSCGRCVILAGKWFRKNEGFRRHPRCDCSHVPAVKTKRPEAPEDVFASMTKREQDAAFTKAGAAAIRAGADPARVVNVTGRKSGLATPAGKRMRNGKPTPFALFERHGSNPERFAEALAENGYVVPR